MYQPLPLLSIVEPGNITVVPVAALPPSFQPTVFPRIDAAAFIYFIVQFGAATIRGRRLFEGGVYYFGQYDRARTQHP